MKVSRRSGSSPSAPITGGDRFRALTAVARTLRLIARMARRTAQPAYWSIAMVLLCGVFATPSANAHEYKPGVVAIKEVKPGRFLLQWSPPMPNVEDLELRLPGDCTVDGSRSLQLSRTVPGLSLSLECGPSGLGGELGFDTESTSAGRIGINVEWLDGTESFKLTTGDPPAVMLGATASPNSTWQVLGQYVLLGVEHIWLGVDHLLFLLGLLILVRGFRRVLLTVTAFTLAHSITLGAASLELLTVSTAPVEICIALSVLLLAVEATRGPETASRRWPWLVAFGFGLLHGLGFASALSEVGLPKNAVLVSLLGFNLGVELGQLAAVVAVAATYVRLRRHPAIERRMESAAIWVLGICSVFWLLQRVDGWLEPLLALQ